MLILTRKKGESVRISADIEVTVMEVRGDKIKLGIVAPKAVAVHRAEVLERIEAEKAA